MSSFCTYSLYGLRIQSELPLTAPVAHGCTEVDLVVRRGEDSPADATPPAGELWAKANFVNGVGVQLTKTTSGWSLFYPQTGEVRLAADLRTATAHALPGKGAILPLLLMGSVPSWLLNLRGEPVLHASAVAVGGEAVAFIGASGMGKSTLATLLCSAGASLVTDDVLRLQPSGQDFRCHWGTGELRLRPNAVALAGLFPRASARTSADGRATLLLSQSESALPRLRAIIIPQPDRSHSSLLAERLTPMQASFHLNGFPRVFGWLVDDPKRNQFSHFARLAQALPVCRVRIPWGPPFPKSLANELMQMVFEAANTK